MGYKESPDITKMKSLSIENVKPSSLHKLTRITFLVCRVMGLFPVSGLTCNDKSKLRFKLLSPYNILCVISLVGQFTLTILSLHYMSHSELSLRNFYNFLVNAIGFAMTLLIMWLGIKWPALIHYTWASERELPLSTRRYTTKKSTILIAYALLGCILERSLVMLFCIRLSETCAHNLDYFMRVYVEYTQAYVFKITAYSDMKAVILKIFDAQIVLVTVLVDMLIAIIGIYLTTFFEDMNDMVTLYKEKPGMWTVLRTRYTRFIYLARRVNSHFSVLIMVSFGSNLILICIQLFKILRKDDYGEYKNCNPEKLKATMNGVERQMYVIFSFLFLVSRPLLSGLMAARLHTASKLSLYYLHEVDTQYYTAECQRFQEQINMTNVCLSGLDFFNITRRMILSMAATIVTYELVLLQFI